MEKLKEQYKDFRVWQKQPYQVAPLSDSEHDCPTCGTHYQGNYCPRCGQSAKIGRYSFKKAFLLFLDVWGLGNRSMFRTLRDLLLRPGYMIYDYLKGMQMAYFPPFKMFFLLVALSLLIDSGLNLKGEDRIEIKLNKFDRGLEQSQETTHDDNTSIALGEESERNEEAKHYIHTFLSVGKKAFEWFRDHQSIVDLIFLLLISGPLYLLFRRCPRIPDMRFTEFFVAMVYTNNLLMVYDVVISFLCLNPALELLTYAAAIVSLKQLSGYGYGRTILNTAAAVAIFGFILFVLFAIVVIAGIIFAYSSSSV